MRKERCCFAGLREVLGSLAERLVESKVVEVTASGSVSDVLRTLGINGEQVSLVIVKGKQIRVLEMVNDDDEVELVP